MWSWLPVGCRLIGLTGTSCIRQAFQMLRCNVGALKCHIINARRVSICRLMNNTTIKYIRILACLLATCLMCHAATCPRLWSIHRSAHKLKWLSLHRNFQRNPLLMRASTAPRQAERAACNTSMQREPHMAIEHVPAVFGEVQKVFFQHPSAYLPTVAICCLTCVRLQHSPVTLWDAAVAAGVVAFWLLQEWVVHKWLLHSSHDWIGKQIHLQHHQQPYHQVSLDPPGLICCVMVLAAAVFAVCFRGGPLSLTATAAYYSAGLLYEWLHYVVHTRWVPPAGLVGNWLRAVRRHHMLHHMRNEDYWLSFSAPAVDALFGTLPARGSSVPLTAMARTAHGVSAGAALVDDSPASANISIRHSSNSHVPAPVAASRR